LGIGSYYETNYLNYHVFPCAVFVFTYSTAHNFCCIVLDRF